MKVWVSYLYSLIRSEQLSNTKYFDPGNLYRYRELPTDGPEGRVLMFGALGGVVDGRIAFYYSTYFSYQL